MTSSRRWLTGCGAGCGLLLLAGIGACVVGILFLKHIFRGVEKAAASYEELVAERGDVDDYVPPADGAPAAERVEAFARIREVTADARGEVDARLARLTGSSARSSAWRWTRDACSGRMACPWASRPPSSPSEIGWRPRGA